MPSVLILVMVVRFGVTWWLLLALFILLVRHVSMGVL